MIHLSRIAIPLPTDQDLAIQPIRSVMVSKFYVILEFNIVGITLKRKDSRTQLTIMFMVLATQAFSSVLKQAM